MTPTMYRTLLPLLAFLPLTALPAQDPAAAGKQLFTVQLTKGTAAWFKSSVVSTQNVDLGIQQMDMKSDVTWILSAKVLEVPAEGLPVVEFEIAAAKGSMDIPMMGTETFDTTTGKPESEGVGAAMAAVVGMKFKGTVAANGKVVVTDDLSEKLADARDKGGSMGGQMLLGMLNEGGMQHLVDGIFGTLPDHAVAVGDSWDSAEKQTGKAPVTNKLRLQLAKVTDDQIEITGTGTIEHTGATDDKAEDDGDEQMAMAHEMMKSMKIENGKLSGKLIWSRKDGMAVLSSQDLSMDMTMPSPMGGDVKIHQVQKLHLERTTADAAKAKPPADAKK